MLNAELGRRRKLQDPIIRRREQENKSFDMNASLTQAIIKGWKMGSKMSSPVDSLIISPECEIMGRQPINLFFEECRNRGRCYEAEYHAFLLEALAGKQPGLGNVVLTPKSPAQEVLDVFHTSDATVVVIDAEAFGDGGSLTIELDVGRSEGIALFSLFNSDRKDAVSTTGTDDTPTRQPLQVSIIRQRTPDISKLTTGCGVSPGRMARITYPFARGQIFKLRAIGREDNEKGSVNAFLAKISVSGAQQTSSDCKVKK